MKVLFVFVKENIPQFARMSQDQIGSSDDEMISWVTAMRVGPGTILILLSPGLKTIQSGPSWTHTQSVRVTPLFYHWLCGSSSSGLSCSFWWRLWANLIFKFSVRVRISFPHYPHVPRHRPLPLHYLFHRPPKLALRPSKRRTFYSYYWWRIGYEMKYTLQPSYLFVLSRPQCARAWVKRFDVCSVS